MERVDEFGTKIKIYTWRILVGACMMLSGYVWHGVTDNIKKTEHNLIEQEKRLYDVEKRVNGLEYNSREIDKFWAAQIQYRAEEATRLDKRLDKIEDKVDLVLKRQGGYSQ